MKLSKRVVLKKNSSLPADPAYMIARGIKTLELRVSPQNKSAMKIAKYLKDHSKESDVFDWGLQTHLGHDIAKSQMRGFGGMLSFALDGGYNQAEKFLPSLNRVHLASSLGSVSTLVGLFHTTSQRGINRNVGSPFGYSRKFNPLFSRN